MKFVVLVVDDCPEDQEVMRRALVAAPDVNPDVLLAEDEESCLRQLAAHPEIDCILLDYGLQWQGGLDFLKSLVESHPKQAIFMMTGNDDAMIAKESIRAGAQDYVRKDWMSVSMIERALLNAISRKALENRVKEQNESLQFFANVLVHDLRAPLRAIQQSAGWLAEDLEQNSNLENAELLDFISKGAKRMDALIMALDAYNHLDAPDPEFRTVDLNEAVQNVRGNLAGVLCDRNATLICDTDLPAIWGNAPQIEQLLQNLICNGVKYNRSRKPVIRLSAIETDRRWMINVEDNGIGIEQDELERIFDPFKRLNRADEFEGTGLGLAMCRKIAERHGAALTCHSQIGSGSTFTLTIPKHTAASDHRLEERRMA